MPYKTFPYVLKEIGPVMHTRQSKGNVTKWSGYKISYAILFGNDLEGGLHIFGSDIHMLQNAKDEKS